LRQDNKNGVAMKKFLTAVAIALTLTGCAGSGKIKWDNARQVKAGMTQAEVTELMGKPYQVTAKGDGIQTWVWVYVNGMTGSSQSAALNFKDGKVIKAFEVPDSF
jgi:outer membrane protein assembly factor BamE (lipoprotein component of BamABCDE complex)